MIQITILLITYKKITIYVSNEDMTALFVMLNLDTNVKDYWIGDETKEP